MPVGLPEEPAGLPEVFVGRLPSDCNVSSAGLESSCRSPSVPSAVNRIVRSSRLIASERERSYLKVCEVDLSYKWTDEHEVEM